jgi:hypothetical protein
VCRSTREDIAAKRGVDGPFLTGRSASEDFDISADALYLKCALAASES